MLLKSLLPLVNSHQTLSCQSQIHLFPGGGGVAWLITEFLQTLCQMHHFHQIRLFHHIFPRSLALAKLDHFAIFLIASFFWRISKKHLDLMDQQSQQSLNPPWKIAAVWVQLLLSYLLHVDKFLIKHYQLNSRHKKTNCFPWFHHLFQSPCIGRRTTTFNSWSSRLSHTISYKVFSTEKTWNDQTASEVLLCGLFLFCELSDNRNYNSFWKVSIN